MAVSQEVVVSVIEDLLPSWNETFSRYNPAWSETLKASGGLEELKSTNKSWILTSADPGVFTEVQTSHELIQGGRTQSGVRAHAWPSFYIYATDIGLQEMRKARGERDVGQLVESVPERAALGIMDAMEQQFIMGDHAKLGGMPTLNGQQTYSPEGHVTQGLLEFAAPDSQTGTIFGHARNSFEGWHNQYGEMSAMNQDGLRAIRKMYRECSQQGAAALGGPKVWMCDGASWDNYLEVLGDRVVINDKQGYDPQAGQGSRVGLPMGLDNGAKLFTAPSFNLAGFSGKARNGVMYAIDCNQLGFFRQETGDAEYDGKKSGDTPFLSMRNVGRLQTSDAIRLEWLLSAGMLSKQLRTHGVMVGSAIE